MGAGVILFIGSSLVSSEFSWSLRKSNAFCKVFGEDTDSLCGYQ